MMRALSSLWSQIQAFLSPLLARVGKGWRWFRQWYGAKPWHRKLIWGTGIFAASLLVLVLGTISIVFAIYGARAASFDLTKLAELPERTLMIDRNGKELGHVYGHGENRLVVGEDGVSEWFVKALLAREDSRFYRHGGIDWLGVVRAMIVNIQEGEIEQGASTLTMQLARGSFGLQDRDYDRKLLESAIALRIESKYSKEEILEFYMNRIYFGAGFYGIERASQGYFMKSASELTLAQSALLAGLIRAPSGLNPFKYEADAVEVQGDVLDRMVASRIITRDEADDARQDPLNIRPVDQRDAEPNYVIQVVHDELDRILDPEWIQNGGLRIHLAIDQELQERATLALQERLKEMEQQSGWDHPTMDSTDPEAREAYTPFLQGAVVVLDNATGGVLAIVGGRDYERSPFNRAMQAKRQVGSTFKPFVYATAFSQGVMPGTMESDDPISMPGGENGRPWTPSNSDGASLGSQPIEVGLIRSRNTMSVRVGMQAGVENVLRTASALGLGEELPQSPVSFLGAFEADPLAMTSAYTVFPNNGVRKRPFIVSRIETQDGYVLYQTPVLQYQVLPAYATWMTSEALGDVVDRGTAASARSMGFEVPAYGKTGTTDDFKDAWFVGYTDKVTCGVWVGFDKPQTIMYRGYGSVLALPVWVDVMGHAVEHGYPAEALRYPGQLVNVRLCSQCGKPASRLSRYDYETVVPAEAVSEDRCHGHGPLAGDKKGDGKGLFKKIGKMLGF